MATGASSRLLGGSSRTAVAHNIENKGDLKAEPESSSAKGGSFVPYTDAEKYKGQGMYASCIYILFTALTQQHLYL